MNEKKRIEIDETIYFYYLIKGVASTNFNYQLSTINGVCTDDKTKQK